MRCPKCGFISFDHVDSCLNCNKDISKAMSQIEGTTFKVTPPAFLKFDRTPRPQDDGAGDLDLAEDTFDVVDPDLDVLVEDDEPQEEREISFNGFGEQTVGQNRAGASHDDEDDDVGIDLGDFEDAFEEEEPAHQEISLNLPDELADLSDLSAPKKSAAPAPRSSGDDLDLDLELEELGEEDFTLSLEGDEQAEDALGALSLDDLGLAEEKPAKPKVKRKATAGMDMDADLDFDLDLGGLSLDK